MLAQASLLLLVGLTGISNIEAQTKRGVTPEDYFSFQFVGDPHISPDGSTVAYELTTIDQKKNRRDNAIWTVAIDGHSAPRRLTAEGFNSSAPRWSPDGARLAFLSSRTAESDAAGRPARKSAFFGWMAARRRRSRI